MRFVYQLSLRDIFIFFEFYSENHQYPHSVNFEGIDAIGHVVCVRGVTIESYDFDYRSNIFVFTGKYVNLYSFIYSLREFLNILGSFSELFKVNSVDIPLV